jgi:hypothetical protein
MKIPPSRKIEDLIPSVDTTFDAYRTERRFWQEQSERATLALNRSLITLSMAGIGFTVALVTQQFTPTDLFTNSLLVLSWIAFLATIAYIHRSYSCAGSLAKAAIDEEDAAYERSGEEAVERARSKRQHWDDTRARLVRRGHLTFYAAIGFTLIFVILEFAGGR